MVSAHLKQPVPLPCLIAVGPLDKFVPDSQQRYAGSIAVLIWAYGRTPRAPLQCLKRFILRIGTSEVSCAQGRDMVYAATLKDRIDLSTLLECLKQCKVNHFLSCERPNW